MKSSLFIVSGLLLASASFAQTQKGNGILSGSLFNDYSRQERPFVSQGSTRVATVWQPTLSITAGRFWTDGWLAGLTLSGASTSNRQNLETNPNQTYSSTNSSIGATPFIRRYWQVTTFHLFAGAGLSVNFTKNIQSYFDSNGQLIESGQKTSLVTVAPRLEVGANYFLTNRLSLQLTASSSALPIGAAGLSAGLTYWTGPGRTAVPQEERANSQTDRGKWVLEGSLSVVSQKNDQVASNNGTAYQSGYTIYSSSPSVGLFIKKNTLLGIGLPVIYAKNQVTSPNAPQTVDDVWSIGVSPYIQHYWSSTRLTPYTRVNVTYLHETGRAFSDNVVSGGINIGLAYMAGQRFIIETSLANASVTYLVAEPVNNSGKTNTWNVKIAAGLTGTFAIRYVL